MTASMAAERPPGTDSGPLQIGTAGGVRTLTLNRPGSYNALNLELKGALLSALTEAAEQESVRAVVISGAGRAFCAGQDLKEHLQLVQSGDPRVATTVRDFYNVAVPVIVGMRKPVIAAVNGAAAGAGAGLAYACDLRVAARSANFSMAFAGVGLSADSGASFTLPRLVGAGRAARLMLLGERVDADEALRIGLVDEVVDDDELTGRVATLAATLADGPTLAYAAIKSSLHFASTNSLQATLDFEERTQAALFAGNDHHEAIAAFAEKRPARFTGT